MLTNMHAHIYAEARLPPKLANKGSKVDKRARQPNAIMAFNKRWPSEVIRKLAVITPIHHRPHRLLQSSAAVLARCRGAAPGDKDL